MREQALRGLYLVTPDTDDSAGLLVSVGLALQGARPALLQYRSKQPDTSLRSSQARGLASLCRAMGVPLVVNDDVELALAVGADGVHLGRDDGDLGAARRALRTCDVRFDAMKFTLSVRSFQVPATPSTCA